MPEILIEKVLLSPRSFNHPEGVRGRQFVSSNDRLADRGHPITNVNELHIGNFGSFFRDFGGHTFGSSELFNFIRDALNAGARVTFY
jgi:hypothetical protein